MAKRTWQIKKRVKTRIERLYSHEARLPRNKWGRWGESKTTRITVKRAKTSLSEAMKRLKDRRNSSRMHWRSLPSWERKRKPVFLFIDRRKERERERHVMSGKDIEFGERNKREHESRKRRNESVCLSFPRSVHEKGYTLERARSDWLTSISSSDSLFSMRFLSFFFFFFLEPSCASSIPFFMRFLLVLNLPSVFSLLIQFIPLTSLPGRESFSVHWLS